MEKKYLVGTFAVLVMAVIVFGIGGIINTLPVPEGVGQGIKYNSNVCVYKNEELIGCQHNVITNGGLDMVKTSLGEGTSNVITDLALGNEQAPAAGDSALPGLYEDSGLTKASGAYNSNGVGNWSVAHTWTSTGDNKVVNTTGLYKDGGNLFAGTSFASTTLQTDDQIKVNYTIWVTGS